MEKIKWTDLQKHVKLIFEQYQVADFKDVVEKDRNGWNWVLSFEELRGEQTILIHTKFIFKLDKDQEHLRKNEFLYLKGLNSKYRLVKFKDLKDFEKLIFKILNDNLFDKDISLLSNFLISPEQDVNDYFYNKKIEGYTVFDLHYTPSNMMKEMKFKFLCNVNNDQEFNFSIEKKSDVIFTFKYSGKTFTTKKPSFEDISETVADFIIETLDKF